MRPPRISNPRSPRHHHPPHDNSREGDSRKSSRPSDDARGPGQPASRQPASDPADSDPEDPNSEDPNSENSDRPEIRADEIERDLRAIYNSPPNGLPGRAYLELVLVVAERLRPERTGQLSARVIYESLSDASVSAIRATAGGVTEVASVPGALTIQRASFQTTRYDVGAPAARVIRATHRMGIPATEIAGAAEESMAAVDGTPPGEGREGDGREGDGRPDALWDLIDRAIREPDRRPDWDFCLPKGRGSSCSDTPQNRRSERSGRVVAADEIEVFINRQGTKAQRDMLDEALDGRPYPRAERRMVLDLVAEAYTWRYSSEGEGEAGWVPITYDKILRRYMGFSENNHEQATEPVWRGSVLIEAWRDGWYSPGHDSEAPAKSRAFRIKPEVFEAWITAGQDGPKRWHLHTAQPKRTSPRAPLKTRLTDANGNRYPDLVDEALRILKDADHVIALDALNEAERSLARRTDRTSRLKLRQLQLSKEVIERQAEAAEGRSRLQNAYEVQELSGRTGFREGGPQGLLKAVKHKAYSHYTNYDIKSCHTAALREVVDVLAEEGLPIDMRPLEDYLDRGGKNWAAHAYDLPRPLVKITEHAVKYGAVLPKSMAQAHNADVYPHGVPAVAEAAQKHADAPDAALEKLREIFADIRAMVTRIADALTGPYYDAVKTPGSWMMYNACGIGFRPSDYDEGHKRRSKAMAWRLQGLEAAFCHSVTILSGEYDYDVVANEHDGLIVDGTVPSGAIARAQAMSGFTRAEFVEKPFADAGDIEAVYGRPRRGDGSAADTCPADAYPADTCPADTCPADASADDGSADDGSVTKNAREDASGEDARDDAASRSSDSSGRPSGRDPSKRDPSKRDPSRRDVAICDIAIREVAEWLARQDAHRDIPLGDGLPGDALRIDEIAEAQHAARAATSGTAATVADFLELIFAIAQTVTARVEGATHGRSADHDGAARRSPTNRSPTNPRRFRVGRIRERLAADNAYHQQGITTADYSKYVHARGGPVATWSAEEAVSLLRWAQHHRSQALA